ncbi:MAG: recombinase family protein [Acutalibacteraceae bacterium]
MKRIAACYIRVSTEEQIEYSPQSQLKEIRKYAKEHNYYIPDEYVFADEGISGRSTAKRPAFNRMIAAAKRKPKPFEAVLLWKFSRFARNRTDAIVYKNLLRNQCGIDVISISESLGDDKGTAVILESMFEAMDEYYSINLSAEVKRTMQMKAENGEALIPAPFGYQNENKQFVIDPERAPIVRMIFDSYEKGCGTRKIAVMLGNMGVRTKRGNLPDNRFVEYILRNPVYIGKIRWSDGRQNNRRRFKGDLTAFHLYDGQHEAIISPEQFDRVQKALEEAAKQYSKYQRKEAPKDFMLKGLVRCSSCGGTLTKSSAATPSLQCHNYSRGSCHTSHHITIAKLDSLISQALKAAVSTLNFDIEVKSGNSCQDYFILSKMLDNEKRKLGKVKIAYEEGIDSLEEYKQNKARITANISRIEKDMFEASKTPNKEIFANKIGEVIDIIESPAVSPSEKNAALRTIISKIELCRPGNNIRIFFYT